MASRRSIPRRQRYAQDPDYRARVLANGRRYRVGHKDKIADYERRRRYGLSGADYAALLSRQGGRCAVCRRKGGRRRPLQVDHCHSSGRVRGLLCHKCNSMLGMSRDDPGRLRAGIAYLTAAEGGAGSC